MALTVAQDGSATGASTTPTTSINITEASNQTLVVFLAVDDSVDQNGTFTYDSVSMGTAIAENTSGTGLYCGVWILKNPNSGSALTLSGTIDNSRTWGVIWAVLNDNDQTTAYDSGTIQTSNSASATTSGVTVSSATNDLVLSFLAVNNKAEGVISFSGTGQTGFEALTCGENAMAIEGTYTAGAASVTTAWSWDTGAGKSEIGIDFNVAAGGGGPSIAAIARFYEMLRTV